MRLDAFVPCPACGLRTLPNFDNSLALTTACQNAACRKLFDRDMQPAGYYTMQGSTSQIVLSVAETPTVPRP